MPRGPLDAHGGVREIGWARGREGGTSEVRAEDWRRAGVCQWVSGVGMGPGKAGGKCREPAGSGSGAGGLGVGVGSRDHGWRGTGRFTGVEAGLVGGMGSCDVCEGRWKVGRVMRVGSCRGG